LAYRLIVVCYPLGLLLLHHRGCHVLALVPAFAASITGVNTYND